MEKFIIRSRMLRIRLMSSVFMSKSTWLFLATLMTFSFNSRADTILLVHDKGEAFSDVKNGFIDEIDGEFTIESLEVTKSTSSDAISKSTKKINPKLIVLAGNTAVKFYADYQKSQGSDNIPASLVVAALFADKLVGNLKNATAIRYEIPAVTSMVNLRSISSGSMQKIGVIYREWMKDLIKKNKDFLAQEGFQLVTVSLDNKTSKPEKDIKKAIKNLKKEKIDALWIINDNTLLNGNTLKKAWIPGLKNTKFSVVVNAETLISTKFKFGNFAVYPDHYGLGIQVANAVFDIADSDWSIDDRDIEEPLSVKKALNVKLTEKKGIELKSTALSTVDKVVKK
ncbi:MAG: hypothetical protein AAGB12_00895 [Pseudomonadota bacterium]